MCESAFCLSIDGAGGLTVDCNRHGKEDAAACIQDGIVYIYPPSGKALLRPGVNLPVPKKN